MIQYKCRCKRCRKRSVKRKREVVELRELRNHEPIEQVMAEQRLAKAEGWSLMNKCQSLRLL